MRIVFLSISFFLLSTSLNLFAQTEQSSETIFEDFSWLNLIIDRNDCQEIKVTVFSSNGYDWAHIETVFGNKVYTYLGDVNCSDSPLITCIDIYPRKQILATWTCPESDTPKPGCTDTEADNFNPIANQDDGSCIYDRDDSIFEQYTWLSYFINPENCNKEEITIYDHNGTREAYLELDEGTYIIDVAFNGPYICSPTAESINNSDCLSITSRNISQVVEIWSCDGASIIDGTESPRQTVVDVIKESEDHQTLEAAIDAAGLKETLAGEGPFTIFAPTDAAFAALPNGTMEALMEDPTGELTEVLQQHVLSMHAESAALTEQQTMVSLNGNEVNITVEENSVFINDAKVTIADIVTDNGVVHVIDKVLTKKNVLGCTDPNAANYNSNAAEDDGSCRYEEIDETIFERYPWLMDYVDSNNCNAEKITVYNFVIGIELLVETNEGSYIFYDDGFPACTPSDEVVLGESCPDFLFRDISNVVETWECGGITTFNETVDDVIKSKAELSFFSIATSSYGADLSAEGPFTVFAPDNNALTSVYENIAIFGFIDPPANYTATLNNHVVEGVYRSTDLFDGQILTSISGKELIVSVNSNGVFVNGAQVTTADLETTNGVVHIVNKVLVLEPILSDYPWLESFIDFESCTNERVSVYQSGTYFYVYIQGAENKGQLFTRTGQSFCDDDGDFTCLELYRFQTVIDNWTCPNYVEPIPKTVIDVIVASEDHNSLEIAVDAAGLTETLSGEGPFTVFAPTDKAFEVISPESLGALFFEAALPDTYDGLTDLLLYHVLDANILSSDLSNGQNAATLRGSDVSVRITEEGVFINDAMVTVADIVTENGVVHVIDAVLLPPPPEQATVFDIIANSVDHNILEAYIESAGLAETLSGEGSFTVFAPTDKAMVAVPEGLLTTLLADPTGDLAQTLLYHVLGAQIESSSLTDRQTAATLNGANIEVTINNNGIFINDAKVTIADIVTENGVVHVIDAVLLPKTENQQANNPLIFETYNWLSDVVNTNNCNTGKITVYNSGFGTTQYLYIEDANGGSLYTDYGVSFCTSTSGNSCVDTYRLTIVEDSWTCNDDGGTVNPPIAAGELPQALKDLEWLNDKVDFNNCAGSSIEIYDFGGYSFIFVIANGINTMYLDNGTFYCETSSTYNCKSLYGINRVADVFWNCGGINKTVQHPSETGHQKNTVKDFNYQVYPNPGNGLVYLKLSKTEHQIQAVNFYDTMGKLVLSQTLNTLTPNQQLYFNLSSQPKGLYMVELIGEKIRATEKLIIE